ncbi:protein phosphatase type 1 regulator-like protein [Strigomonas culicis]|uniref:Protein phosphatase type 1 regulator-like protein n=2 Tax=Strigomonas culicis TaxID=28005 RepID=S9U7R3_9TRYP|nr:protein phosphatase type 1 regulator-like protein [Strigomonas culicis]EPY27967.1 protein phosphatase type 1 regulator-like protein [Strigomonas culicis]|eukprot:EPY26787.1 protein phosphatase type 1 regulator-like protein [Strigomonas culicis]
MSGKEMKGGLQKMFGAAKPKEKPEIEPIDDPESKPEEVSETMPDDKSALKTHFTDPQAHQASDEESGKDEALPARHEASHKIAEERLRIDVNSEFVEITNIRLFGIDELDLNSLTSCTTLSLRKNLIHELSSLPLHLANRLQCLDLFDNKIKKLRDFFVSATVPNTEADDATLIKQPFPQPFSAITKVDLSYNQFKKIKGLDSLGPTLKELYFVENKIKVIEGLDNLVNLEVLELGGNQIRDIGNGLDHLVNLKQLWLGKNKIANLGTSFHKLKSLEMLSLQANRITKIDPETFQEGHHPSLKELYLSENGIEVIENLPIHSLKTLDFSFNPIKNINAETVNVENLPDLEEFWLTDGKIDSWDEVQKLAPFSRTMQTVYLERNPIEQDKRYRDKIYMYLPFLVQIDSWPIVNKDNVEADRSIQRKNPI